MLKVLAALNAPGSSRIVGGRQLRLAVGVVALLVGLVVFGRGAGAYYDNVALLTFLSIILALSLRLLMLAGEASLCHGGFYALGAYTVAILTANHGFSFWVALPLGGLVAAVGAVVVGVPSLRTSGAYFFLMTFGSLIVLTSILQYWTSLTGGFSGISAIRGPIGIGNVDSWFFLALGLLVVVVAIFVLFERSRWGLELRAVGDSRPLAQSVGIDPFFVMLTAFAVGAFFAGIAGGFYASYITFVSPSSFTFWLSTYILMYVVIGGSRFLLGAVVGAVFLSVLPVLGSWSQNYVSIFVSGATLLAFLVAPRGIVTTVVSLAGRVGVRTRPTVALADAPERAERRAAARLTAPGEPVLGVAGVSKRFGGVTALQSVDLEVRAGETLGIIGPNGAGKTTLFNIVS